MEECVDDRPSTSAKVTDTLAKVTEQDFPMKVTKQDFPMRETKICSIRFNAFTSAIGFVMLWGFAAYCMIDPANAKTTLTGWRSLVSHNFTWFYIGANPAFSFFLVYITYRYGDIKLGLPHEKPEFSDTSYFAMIFSSGVAVGLFFYGVSEPLWHRASHWFVESGYRSQDEVDQWAIMLTVYHWGFAGWSPYVVMALASGLATYRYGLPLTVRTTMYAIFGNYTWGWIGDIIDGFSIVTTVAGVCTSLGLGTMQIIAGLQVLGLLDSESKTANVVVIWIITATATVSVVSGLHYGIKFLSQLGFGIGMVLLGLVFLLDNTVFLSNLIVQTTGYYFQWAIFQLPFWTDAFGQLTDGEGRAPIGASATWWLESWTVFYMAWWAAWSCFVGLFIARISRGRTIKEVVIYCFIAPMLYSIIWFCVFGGVGIRQARQATELNLLGSTYFNNTAHFQVDGNPTCYDVPQGSVETMVNGTVTEIFVNKMLGVTPVCEFDSTESTAAMFNVLNSFVGFGPFLTALSLVAITIYFVTSSDSGSLVVDTISTNGREDHHVIQRIFWALTEGLVATALLVSGGSDALGALQAASIVGGLPVCLFLFLMCISIKQMCEYARANPDSTTLPDPSIGGWKMPIFGGIFNVIEWIVSFGSVHEKRITLGMDKPTSSQVVGFFQGLLLPFILLHSALSLNDPRGLNKALNLVTSFVYFVLFVAWIVFYSLGYSNSGYSALGWVCFLLKACILTNVRLSLRRKFAIRGNIVGDFFASSFAYPQTLYQIVEQSKASEESHKENDEYDA